MVERNEVVIPAGEQGAMAWGMCNVVGDALERPKEAALRNDDDVDDDDDELPSVDDLVVARSEFLRLRGKGDGTPGLAPGEILRPVSFPGYKEPVDLMALYERFEELLGESVRAPKVGDRVTGTIFDVSERGASIDFGGKNIGYCPSEELALCKIRHAADAVAIGQRREFSVLAPPPRRRKADEEFTLLSLKAIAEAVAWKRIQQYRENDLSFTAVLKGKNRGGYMVEVPDLSLAGFLPKGQSSGPLATLPDTADPSEFMEQVVDVKVLDLDPERKRLILSQRAANPRLTRDAYQIGTVHEGIVQSIQPYGVFLDVGGISGLLHLSQISHSRIESVEGIFKLGDKIKVMVLSQDPVQGRLSLTTKRLEPTHGDMLTNPKLVYEQAEEMAARFRADIEIAEKRMRAFEDKLAMSEGGPVWPTDARTPVALD
jgi:small subunit ribosomal protein S1